MKKSNHTPSGAALTDLILDLFKINNQLLTAGDRLVGNLGLTSARWQVLGAIVAASAPQPVAWLARDMGAHRQNVQRIVNDLEKSGLITNEPNPHHKRASLVVLTKLGQKTFDDAMSLQALWVNDLTNGLTEKEIRMAHKTIGRLLQKLETSSKTADKN